MNRLRGALQPAGLALALLFAAVAAAAQDTTRAGPDTTQQAAPAPAPLPEPPEALRLPIPEPAVTPGPLPLHSRASFTRDSLLWTRSQTLAELLAAIPGVFVARAGFLGQPQYAAYAGRGAGAIEVYWDGLPMFPLGGDSLSIEPGSIPLSYLDRVDVEILPSTLRVNLVSTRHPRRDPRSVIQVTAGDFETSVFAGLFQKRWSSGIGINLAADFTGTDGASGMGRGDQWFDTWARLDWIPTEGTGVTYQVRRQRLDRDEVDTTVPERKGARTDFLFSMFTGTRAGGLGLRAEAGLGTSSWTDDSLVADRRIRQAFLTLGYRRPNLTAQVAGRLADARATAGADGRFGWVPIPGVILSGGAAWQRHELDRRSISAHGSLGLFGGPFSLSGTVELRDGLQAPSLAADTALRTVDGSVRVGFDTPILSGHAALVRRERYQPLPYPSLAAIAGLDSSAEATYVVADVRIRTSRALSLHGWYSTPAKGAAASLQPPKHGRAELTYRSKFLRTFRSGAFEFMVQIAMESWSTGPAGFDRQGTPLTLPGATVYDAFIQFQLVGFTLFWNFRNGYNAPDPYLPGYPYPSAAQTFGVKWEFAN